MTAAGGRVVVQAAMSLDGFIAGPDHDMDWVFEYTAPEEFPDIVADTGAMLSGRRSYDVGQRDAGKPARQLIVLTGLGVRDRRKAAADHGRAQRPPMHGAEASQHWHDR